MSIDLQAPAAHLIVYPETDGEPMAENTLQFEYIVTVKCGLELEFQGEENVFVAGDLFWYPVEGNTQIRVAPDTLVVFGRPKGHRRSYLQWQEGNISPQVVFEIVSPSNRAGEMTSKFSFYQQYGVEEYYLYDPELGELWGWLRQGSKLQEVPRMEGWVSPRLQVRFEIVNGELRLIGRDGKPFATYSELAARANTAEAQRDQLAKNLQIEQERAAKLAAQLKSLGIDPET